LYLVVKKKKEIELTLSVFCSVFELLDSFGAILSFLSLPFRNGGFIAFTYREFGLPVVSLANGSGLEACGGEHSVG